MNRVSHSQADDATASGYRVELPRVSDAVARSLRDAYSREPSLPEEFIRLLRRLNRLGKPGSH
jgi:hypothetical protein